MNVNILSNRKLKASLAIYNFPKLKGMRIKKPLADKDLCINNRKGSATLPALNPPQVPMRPRDKEFLGHHVEYPQYESICRMPSSEIDLSKLFPGIVATTEATTLYAFCYAEEIGKVRALKENLWLNPKNSSYSDPT